MRQAPEEPIARALAWGFLAAPEWTRASLAWTGAEVHDAGRNGPEAANRDGHPDFRAHLNGRVGWVEAVNPARGARLRAQYDAIGWAE